MHSETGEASQTPFGFARVDRSRQRRLWRSSESSEKIHRVAFESDSQARPGRGDRWSVPADKLRDGRDLAEREFRHLKRLPISETEYHKTY